MLFGTDTPELARFRGEVREWLAATLPQSYRHQLQCLDPLILRDWHRILHARGWVAPNWPREHGGMGASLDEHLVLLEELTRAGAPYLLPTGINLLGPAVMAFGTPEQQATHLPKMLTGEVFWAQGYSEPNAGSDLAALMTHAEIDGDDFVVTGQKIWSSYAHFCDWIFALVRTDRTANPKHAGISMLLIDLRSPGIEVRPLTTIAGHEEFAVVDFQNVRVPRRNLLGPLHGGWKVANHVLVWERLSNGSPRNALIVWRKIVQAAKQSGRWDDPVFCDRLAVAEIRFVAHLARYRGAIERVKGGEAIDTIAPLLKISSTELLQSLNDLLLEAAGPDGASWNLPLPDEASIELAPSFLLARRASIYGGTNEIQRNILATRVLGFPKAW